VCCFLALPCRFFSILFLRAAKLHSAFGGGSMTLLPLVPGRPASGTKASLDMSKYQTLSEEQKQKLQEVLEKRKVSRLSKDKRGGGGGERGGSMRWVTGLNCMLAGLSRFHT
jgi:hypothetical protein